MCRSLSRWWALMLASALSGCATSREHVGEAPSDSLRSIYIVRRGWHTGIAVAKADWPNQRWTVLSEFPGATHLEFGWGDKRFYQTEWAGVWLAIRAAFWPTSSVVHVIGLRAPVPAGADANAIVEVRVPITGVEKLADAIEQEFVGAHPAATGVTLSTAPTPNRFYKAQGNFFFPRMCNWWIASRLQEAGCSVMPWTVISADRVIREAHGCAAGTGSVR